MIPQGLEFLLRAYWRVSRGMTLGVRGIAQNEAGDVMLVRHGYRPGWYLPGGGVEHGQTAEQALAAEMEQEVGMKPVGRPALFGVYSNHARFSHDHVLLYHVTAWTPCKPTSSKAEIAERQFFPLAALPDGVTTGTRARLAEVFEGAPRNADW